MTSDELKQQQIQDQIKLLLAQQEQLQTHQKQLKSKALKKPMDKDESFRAVEILVPKEEINKNKQVMPEWKTATFHFIQDKCHIQEFENEKEAAKSYKTFKGEKMMI